MSNQRVVVLTDELTEPIYDIIEACCGAQADGRGEFVAYMRGERNGEWRFGGWLGFGGKLYSSSQGVYVDCYPEHRSPLAAFAIKTANERIEALLESSRTVARLEAALEHPEGITEWRWVAGDEGDSKYEIDHGEPRRSREEAEADLASVVAEADPPFDHQGIESRQCGPWVESSRTVGQEDR